MTTKHILHGFTHFKYLIASFITQDMARLGVPNMPDKNGYSVLVDGAVWLYIVAF